ncbi:MAG: hypothetical protein QOF76_4393 [Solirubrobacteraceae bacterium]|nr:hypothetical protein [Solirubrobacteraceae bacterium]
MSVALQGRARLSDRVVFRQFGDGVVLLDLDTGRYFGLNETAGLMVETLAETGDVLATAEQIAATTEQPLHRVAGDLAELCAQLADRDLIILEGTAA